MRRAVLLILGLCGSLFFGWQLVLSANSILEDGQISAVSETSIAEDNDLLFPIAVPDTCLIAQYPVLYEGPYLEDGSDEYVVDVAAIVLFNTARTGIDHARVVLQWDQGEYVFEAQMLPPREAVMVLDKSRQKFQQHQWTACEGLQQMGEGNWLDQQALVVEEVDMAMIQVQNITDKPLQDIRIYHKSYLLPDEVYIGGITYCAGIKYLAPGESVQISPFRYVKDYSKIVRITYRGQTNVDIFGG